MSRYEKYKDSGIEWIGEIPEQWDVKKIKHRCYVKGRVGWKGLKSSEFLTNGFSYLVTGTDFKNDTVDWDNCYHIDEERYNEDPYIQLQNEDLLITKDGTIGKLAVVTNLDKPACLNSGIFVVRSTKEDFSTRYLLWVLKSSIFTDFNGLTAYGSTIQHLYQNVFVEFAFAFPPVNTQISIANYLQKKTAEIDQIISNKQKLVALYEEEKQAIINQAITKGLDPNVKLKDTGIEWLGEIPEHWEVKKLMYLVKILSGYSPDQCQPTDNGEIDYIKVDDVDKNNFEVANPSSYTSKNFIVSTGQTILFPKRGAAIALNKVGVVNKPICFDTNLMGLKLISEKNEVFYIAYVLKSFSLISIADTSTIPQINNKHISPFQIPLPPLNEQKDILEHINIECNKLNTIIAKVKKQIELLQEYRTTLISEVVTGKIKVC